MLSDLACVRIASIAMFLTAVSINITFPYIKAFSAESYRIVA